MKTNPAYSSNAASDALVLNDQELVIVQFRTSKKLPCFAGIPQRSGKKREDNEQLPGEQFLPPTEKTDISLFALVVLKNWRMVDAFVEYDTEVQRYLAQFMFAKKDGQTPQTFKDHRWRYAKVFETLADRSYWRVRGYLNPLSSGGRMVVLNCHLPVHRFQGNGTPVMVWQKDKDGNRVGESAVPIPPAISLFVTDSAGTVELGQLEQV